MARDFDGSERLATASTPVTTFPFTMHCWIRTTNMTQAAWIFGIYNSTAGNQMLAIGFRGDVAGDPAGLLAYSGGVSTVESTTGLTSGQWHSIAGRFISATDKRIYVDAAGENTLTTNRAPTGLDVIGIGQTADSSPANAFTGQVAECAIWNADLTTTDLTVLAAGFSPRMVNPATLVYYMPGVRELTGGADQDLVGGLPVNVAAGTPATAVHPRIIYPPRPEIGLIGEAAAPPVGETRTRSRLMLMGVGV